MTDYGPQVEKLMSALPDEEREPFIDLLSQSVSRAIGPLTDAIRDELLAGRDAAGPLAAWLNARALGRAASPH